MMHSRTARLRARALSRLAAVAVVAVVLAASGCAQSKRGQAVPGGTLTFGAAGAPKLFDPFYASDGETFRVARQMFEGLVGFAPGTAKVQPLLATSWDESPDGRTWTFHLRDGVTFHDGTPFDSAAVCANFDRWYHQTGAAQSEAVSQYWVDNFGGFATGGGPSLFTSCTAGDPRTAVVTLASSTSKFPDLLALPAFSMQSPTALKQYDANNVRQQGDSFAYPPYALAHPTGTGPFRFAGYDKANNTVELVRYDGYWGTKANVGRIIFKIIPDETARKQALQSHDIDGYDLPSPGDWNMLGHEGFNVLIRPAFNILYLGINQKNNPELTDLRVRQALAYGINRAQLVRSQLPDKAAVAQEFMPDTVDGYAKDVQQYPYDPDKARQLLQQAGASDLTVTFYWPSEVSRPYMPSPQDLFGAISADLQRIGVKVNAVTKPWNGGYLSDLDAGKADLFLLGWTGDYNTPGNFIGTFFGTTTNRFDTGASPWGKQLAADLRTADAEPDPAKRTQLYQDINRRLMADYLPAVPLSHSPPAVVFRRGITGFVPSPLTSSGESYATIRMS